MVELCWKRFARDRVFVFTCFLAGFPGNWHHIETWLYECRPALGRAQKLCMVCVSFGRSEIHFKILTYIFLHNLFLSCWFDAHPLLSFPIFYVLFTCFFGSAYFLFCLCPSKLTSSSNEVLICACFLKVIDSISKISLRGNTLLFADLSNCFSDLSRSKMDPGWAFNILPFLISCHLIYPVLFHLWDLFVIKIFCRRCVLLSAYKRVFVIC